MICAVHNKYLQIISKVSDFNSMSTHLEKFYA